jgi:hypothetical protein
MTTRRTCWSSTAPGLTASSLLAGLEDENDSVEARRIVVAEKGRGLGRATLAAVLLATEWARRADLADPSGEIGPSTP